jgi:hypothetical protein
MPRSFTSSRAGVVVSSREMAMEIAWGAAWVNIRIHQFRE